MTIYYYFHNNSYILLLPSFSYNKSTTFCNILTPFSTKTQKYTARMHPSPRPVARTLCPSSRITPTPFPASARARVTSRSARIARQKARAREIRPEQLCLYTQPRVSGNEEINLAQRGEMMIELDIRGGRGNSRSASGSFVFVRGWTRYTIGFYLALGGNESLLSGVWRIAFGCWFWMAFFCHCSTWV